MTIEEMTESLNGFEEIAVAKKFGAELDDLPATRMLRALVFIDRKRSGDDDKAAYDACMTLTLKQCLDYFQVDDEVDEEDPVTEGGKDDERPEVGLTL